jgi:hypothetical protein
MSSVARSLQVFGAFLLVLPFALLRFGAVDAIGALWTWSTLRRG